MNKLGVDHYLPVFLKKVEGRVLLFNPVFSKQWQKNESFLQRLKLKPLTTPYLNCFYFDELNGPISTDAESNPEKLLKNLCLQSISLPEKLAESEYYQLMHNNYLSVTEKLISRYVCGHVASSRHILLKDIQVKGVGRTASTHQLSYPNMNGFIQTGEAIRGYYNGQLLKTSLPFGSVNVQAVLAVPDNKLHSSLVIRDAFSHRLAQIEPVFLSEKDKLVLADELKTYYKGLTNLEILKRVFEQHLCLWAMGVDHPMTSDNLALAGFPMDEEDMRPSHEMSGLTLDFIISIETKSSDVINTIENLESIDFTMYIGIAHRLNHLMKWYDEALCWITSSPSKLEEFNNQKLDLMKKILERFYQAREVDTFLEVFSTLKTATRSTKSETLDILQNLKRLGFEFSITDAILQIRQTVLKAKLPIKLKDGLQGTYNSLPRTETEKLVKSYGQLEMMNHGPENDLYIANSSQLHRVVNRQAFSLADEISLKMEDFKDLIEAEVSGYSVKEILIYTKKGELKIPWNEISHHYNKTEKFIIIDLVIDYNGSDFVLPTLKTPIIPM